MTLAKSQSEQPQADFRVAVKVLLIKQGSSVKELAAKLHASRQNVSVAINHPTMLPGLKERIRKELGMPS